MGFNRDSELRNARDSRGLRQRIRIRICFSRPPSRSHDRAYSVSIPNFAFTFSISSVSSPQRV